MLELGDTGTIRDEINMMTMETMYDIFETIGLDAVLIGKLEINDNEQYFAKRLRYPTPHVLSNIHPSENGTNRENLNRLFRYKLSGRGRLYVINLLNPDEIKGKAFLGNRYTVMEPEDFLKDFMKKIKIGDIVIARLSLDDARIDKIMKARIARRIDLFILPSYQSEKYMLDDEKVIAKASHGWEPSNTAERVKSAKSSQFVGPSPPADYPFKGRAVNNPSESATDSRIGTITNSPPEKNPTQGTEPHLGFDKREYMTIENKFRVIPEPQTEQFMREITISRTLNGRGKIKVSDIIIHKTLPEHPEVKKEVTFTQGKQNELRDKQRVYQTLESMNVTVMSKGLNPFAGSDACRDCHESSYDVWKSSSHATAVNTLKRKGKEKNEACLKCHVTEWVKPSYWTRDWSFEKNAPNMDCESCHGPSQAHIEMINLLMSDPKQGKYWVDVKSRYPYLLTDGPLSKNTCLKCHDKSNSPDFDFVKYWDMIIHEEPDIKELPASALLSTQKTSK